jgi:hypothetical protein
MIYARCSSCLCLTCVNTSYEAHRIRPIIARETIEDAEKNTNGFPYAPGSDSLLSATSHPLSERAHSGSKILPGDKAMIRKLLANFLPLLMLAGPPMFRWMNCSGWAMT